MTPGRWILLGAILAVAVYLLARGLDSRPSIVTADGQVFRGADIASPLVAGAVARRSPQGVDFSLHVTDAAGRSVRQVRRGARRVDPPWLEVYNDQGTLVYSGRFAYG